MIRVGQRLREERIKKGLTLEQVSEATKIRASFLAAIEKSEYHTLPSSAYIQGFVKNYADFLGFPKREFAALFRREFNEREFIKVLPEGFSKKENIPIRPFRFGLQAIIVFIIFFLLSGFLLFQFKSAFIGPPLEILSPQQGARVAQTVIIRGKTEGNVVILVNDAPVTVEKSGLFQKTITLFPGKATISIKAQNRFGKQTIIERAVTVQADKG